MSEQTPSKSVTLEQASEQGALHYDDSYTRRLSIKDASVRVRRTYLFEPYIAPSDCILDFGCGTGALLDSLTSAKKSGVEISPTSREEANNKGLDVRGTLEDFQGEKFDKIISAHALEHVLDPAQKLLYMRDLLEEDGLLILCLPINEWVNRTQRVWVASDDNKHLYTWTPLLIGNLLSVCGFEPLEIRTIHQWWPKRFGRYLASRSPTLFHFAAHLSSRLRRKRQLLAVAKKDNRQ